MPELSRENALRGSLREIKERKYYNYYENKANLFSFYLSLDSRTGELKELLGTAYKPIFAIAKNRNFVMYMNKEDCRRIANVILAKIKNEDRWFTNAINQIYLRAESLLEFSKRLNRENLKNKSNNELKSLYEQYIKLFKSMRIYSSIPMMLEHDSPVLSNLLNERLRESINEKELNYAFSVLTTPCRKSYLLNEELQRLMIAEEAAKSKELRAIFRENSKAIPEKIKLIPFGRKIREHTLHWAWLEYLFEGNPLQENDFIEKIEKDLNEYSDVSQRIKEINQIHNQIKHKQEQIVAKYKLPPDVVQLSEVAREIVFLKYFRKGTFAESYYYVEFLLKEIGKRFGLTLDDARAMFDYEVFDMLGKDYLDADKKEEISKREKFIAFISYKGRSYELMKEDVIRLEKNNIIKQEAEIGTKSEIAREIQGQVACHGKAEGRACIVNSKEDMQKMRKGDILVSVMTNPDLFPAMKIAKAIITDVGGLSCHAAIIARELQIPCIIGTKIASKLLKDGMFVEVDTTDGKVKILKRDAK